MKKIVFLLFFLCANLFAKEIHATEQIASLNEAQKKILYEFAVLQKNGSGANAYWLKNQNQFTGINDTLRDYLANEIYVNAHVVYSPVKDSAVQLWMQTQSLTNWMLYLAAFIAICAIIGLLRKYWSSIIDILIKQLGFLFSPILLTYELFVLGIVGIVGGCLIDEMTLRTIVIHTSLFLLWSQSTAIFTRKYLVKRYLYEIRNNFWGSNRLEIVKTICLPAIIVTLALIYVLYKVPGDTLYNYEVVVSGMAVICALPVWRSLEKYICPILVPYKDVYIGNNIRFLATCTVVALFIDVAFLWQSNAALSYVVTALTSLLLVSFLYLSTVVTYRYSRKNYFYLQFVTIFYLVSVSIYSFYVQSGEMIWISLLGVCVFIIIKYWEIPAFFFSWRRGSTWTWGLLGMAVLLWLLAKGILRISEMLYM